VANHTTCEDEISVFSWIFRAPTGGARRDRTDDLKLAKLPLSQLSYGPDVDATKLVGLGGLEPPTSRLSSARSNQLSYKPNPRARMVYPRDKRNEGGGVPHSAALNAAKSKRLFKRWPWRTMSTQ
jgi:hypothetical protein